MKLATRLIGGFLIIAVIALVIGVVGYVNILNLTTNLKEVADDKLISLYNLQVVNEAQTAVDTRENALLAVNTTAEDRAAIYAGFGEVEKRFTDAWKVYEALPKSEADTKEWQGFVPAWDAWWKDHLTFVGLAKEYWGSREGGMSEQEAEVLYDKMSEFGLKTIAVTFSKAETALGQVLKINYDDAMALRQSSIAEAGASEVLMIVVVAAGLVIAVGLGILIANGITRPLNKVVEVGRMVAIGELPDNMLLNKSKDEIGVLTEVFNRVVEALRSKGAEAASIAAGDLTAEIRFESDKDAFAAAFDSMSRSLNDLLSQVTTAVEQVNSGAEQVSSASQALSQGATEQASSLEEISSSITEVSDQTKQNAENAVQASGLSTQAMQGAEKGNAQMTELVAAMQKIAASSGEVKKVVKAIDDIAFQINLLALNANVEAARAGKYGKGFAVVAEEVRNLAVRSAQSVKETTEMVDTSLKSIAEGGKLAEATASQLDAIVQGARKVASLVEEISSASKEQAQAVEQINAGLTQIDQVTQANTASAEESASAAEELSSQAVQLKGMIGRFKLKGAAQVAAPATPAAGTGPATHVPLRLSGGAAAKAASAAHAAPAATATSGSAGNGKRAGAAAKPVADPRRVIQLDDDFGRF